jgi:hypothetical protein
MIIRQFQLKMKTIMIVKYFKFDLFVCQKLFLSKAFWSFPCLGFFAQENFYQTNQTI